MAEAVEHRLKQVEAEVQALKELLGNVATFAVFSEVGVHRFPDGKIPERQTDGAIGYDAFARAIVDPRSKATPDNPLRRTMADFHRTPGWRSAIDPAVEDWVVEDPNNRTDCYAISLPPGERLMVGLGFATNME